MVGVNPCTISRCIFRNDWHCRHRHSRRTSHIYWLAFVFAFPLAAFALPFTSQGQVCSAGPCVQAMLVELQWRPEATQPHVFIEVMDTRNRPIRIFGSWA